MTGTSRGGTVPPGDPRDSDSAEHTTNSHSAAASFLPMASMAPMAPMAVSSATKAHSAPPMGTVGASNVEFLSRLRGTHNVTSTVQIAPTQSSILAQAGALFKRPRLIGADELLGNKTLGNKTNKYSHGVFSF